MNALPVGGYEGDIVMVETRRDFDRAWEDLAAEASVGWDTETRPAFRAGESYLPSLVQAATARAVYLFPLREDGFLRRWWAASSPSPRSSRRASRSRTT